MKSGRKYLTIRKFSELTHTTVDTLKHYDEIGLLTPAYIGENKYRYYLPEQSLILTRILFGKHAGIPLKEIRNFIHSGHHTDAIQKYNEIINDLRARGKETDAIVSTIDNLRYLKNILPELCFPFTFRNGSFSFPKNQKSTLPMNPLLPISRTISF